MAGKQLLVGTVFQKTPPFIPQTVSIDFDGGSEKLETSTASLGFADVWTIACWAKITNTTSRQDTLFTMEGAGSDIRLFQRTTVGTAPSYQLFGNGHNHAWTALPISGGVWHHVLLRWDGADHTDFEMWIDAVDQGAPGFGTIADVNYADDDRTIAIAETSSGVASLLGRVASLAVWDKYLGDDEITAVYNSGSIDFDLANDDGDYISSDNLQHWFQLGKDPDDIGKDYGKADVLLDLMDNQTGITAADIVNDAPGFEP